MRVGLVIFSTTQMKEGCRQATLDHWSDAVSQAVQNDLSISELAIVGCEELALLTSVASIEKKVQAYYFLILQSKVRSTVHLK